jgi:hypothetical protein
MRPGAAAGWEFNTAVLAGMGVVAVGVSVPMARSLSLVLLPKS